MLRQRIGIPASDLQSYTSLLLAVFAGSSVLTSVPAGWVADKTKARQVPYMCGLAALLGATVLLAVGRSIGVLVVARVLQGMSGAVVWTVGLAMVLDTVGPGDLGKVVGGLMGFVSVGVLVGPVLGGVLYEKSGYGGVFGLGAGVLVVDFVMRVLVVEKKVARRYGLQENGGRVEVRTEGREEEEEDVDGPDEEDALLPKKEEQNYVIPEGQNKVVQNLPILYCLSNPRLLVALLTAFVEALLLGAFDATIPLEGEDLFGFDSLKSGLLFIALDLPYLILGVVAGWAVDRYGPKSAAVLGFGYLVPTLTLLRLASDRIVSAQQHNIILFCVVLALNGVGMAAIGPPGLVEASFLVQKYDKANPKMFGENGPYAQLYGFNSLVFSGGLTVGPLLSGALRDRIGYGNMNAALAGISLATAVLSWVYIGGKPKVLSRKTR